MARIKEILKQMGVRPSKVRGQNFLYREEYLDAILNFASPQPDETIVEIGPGLGAMTERLLAVRSPITVIEIEDEFAKGLQEKFPDTLQVINEDIRTASLAKIGSELSIFGNLPYSLSTEIIFSMIHQRSVLKRAVFLLQKEFAERLAAVPSTKAYGSLSVAVQLWCETRLGPLVPGEAFHPPANVTSRVIELSFRREPKVEVPDYDWFEKIVRACFQQRRKKLKNSLVASGRFTPDTADALLLAGAIDGNRRGETLTLEEFARLARVERRP